MEIGIPKHCWQLNFEGEWPTAVAFVGSSRRIAAGNRGGDLLLWDLPETIPEPVTQGKETTPADHAPVRQFKGHTNEISHLRATTDGKLLISSSFDHTIRLWDPAAAANGRAELILDAKARKDQARYKSGDEKEKILQAPGQTVELVESSHVLQGHSDWITALGLSRDEKRLISGDATCQVVVWDLENKTEISKWQGHTWNGIAAAALTSEGETALVSEYSYKRDDFDIPAAALKQWQVAEAAVQFDLLQLQFPKLNANLSTYGSAQVWRKFVADGLITADCSPDGTLFAVGQGGETGTGEAHLFEVASGKFLRSVSGHSGGICDLKFSADGKYLLTSGRDTMIRICQVSDGKEIATLGKERGGQFKDWLHALAISPDQKWVAAADIAGHVQVWSL